ncbi:methylcobalamin:coenzyme M methyltransferase [Oxobacter pfennigii]|uniref:Methylcobalamin:coenzyme M methyltransferase n=1 Tax=Oxobacter pfennigii TaxID=36849 RepID=A0A0P8Z0B0_9CLOT|nr:uroporphyrinogen decarboxylase family protein [Oxobacter pfennigii]KPU45578.1 methylcobalamin:coenzyme M methyltransferase [Oxobacter pfennigii]
MLTKRQNLLETIRGGHPDRFVNQWEAFAMVAGDPITAKNPRPTVKGGPDVTDGWGVVRRFPPNVPAAFPLHDPAHKVVNDITKWKEVVKGPTFDYAEGAWDNILAQAAKVDRNEQFLSMLVTPGIFEQVHYLTGIDDCLMYFYEEPEALHELIDYIVDWKLQYAQLVCDIVKPEVIIHHDDWGSQLNSFMSPDMFAEFIVPGFKKIYGYYKSHGVELIVHHSDSYAANLVPYMIEMGIDIWQGVMTTNNTPELIKKYGGQITFMGDIDNGVVDREDWSLEVIRREVERACTNCGKLYFIPNTTMGGANSLYTGVYETVTAEIDRMSKVMF